MSNEWRRLLVLTLLLCTNGAALAFQAKVRTNNLLPGTNWRLVSLGRAAAAQQPGAQEAVIQFGTDGKRLTGSTGCNRLMGGYSAKGQTLQFTPAALTRMACPAPLMKQENLLLEALRSTTNYWMSKGRLELLGGGETLAAFETAGGENATQASTLDEWMGKWIGPEGTSLLLAKKGTGYNIRIRSLDGVRTFSGTAQGDRIVFTRDGRPESIHAGSGAETGMKWLLEKKKCLIIRVGEGFCQD